MNQLARLSNPFFAILVLTVLLNANAFAQDGWGDLKGRIIVEGTVPRAEDLVIDTDDRPYCIEKGGEFKDRSLLVGKEGGLQNAFVMMYFKPRGAEKPAIHPMYEELYKQPVEINNLDCRFVPNALFLRTGQTFTLKNDDDVGHNCHIISMKNEDNVNLPRNSSTDVTFDLADKAPGVVNCDIHKWMTAVVLIRDEPYAAITDESGNFLIEKIPAGTWSFQFWHKRSGYMRAMQRDGEEFLGRSGQVEITIEDGEVYDFGELRIPAEALQKK